MLKTQSLQAIPCDQLSGVGPFILSRLKKLGLNSVYDLLLHLPLRYEDYRTLTPLKHVRPGKAWLVQGKIISMETLPGRRGNAICQIEDEAGQLAIRFFHFSPHQQKNWQTGKMVRCCGEVRFGHYGFEMTHPEHEFLTESTLKFEPAILPVYPTTEKLSQRVLRRLIKQALYWLNERREPECLPDKVLEKENLMGLREALNDLHVPPISENIQALMSERHPAKKRLIFEELLAHQLSLLYLRQSMQKNQARRFTIDSRLLKQFHNQLPFQLTHAQQRVCDEILSDLAKPCPMLRLVQGDVGSGKTVVAAYSALSMMHQDAQVVLMAPTEILAEQHYKNFLTWFEGFPIHVELLHGKIKTKERKKILSDLAAGNIQFMVGTHAVFQEEVIFNRLALLIIDEQHRFGVHQRMALRDKGVKEGYYPHQLIMTATPIPRTLAMCAYADLDYSVIDELPPGRKPIHTLVIDNQRRQEIVERIVMICETGQQVYWVCTLIEDSEVLQAEAATKTWESLKIALPDLTIALVHGRLTAVEKEMIIADFKAGRIHVLVATTVIEVGVDVPNATLMVIENSERLGLAQLHQLRGRVGRGAQKSYCVLLYQSPLSRTAKERLKMMRESQDGFLLAQKDLELRGPGEFLGSKQTGDIRLRVADLLRDAPLLPSIQATAIELMRYYPKVAKKIHDRWCCEERQYHRV